MVMIILMKKIRRFITIFCLMVFYCYFINISNFPDKIITYQNAKLDYKLCPFLNLRGEILTNSSEKSNIYHVTLSLGKIDIKNVELKRTEQVKVVPCRRTCRN